MKQYRQCRLRRGGHEQTAWIEVRGARAGAEVELLPSRELWTVTAVHAHILPEDALRELQALNRHSLPSVDPIR